MKNDVVRESDRSHTLLLRGFMAQNSLFTTQERMKKKKKERYEWRKTEGRVEDIEKSLGSYTWFKMDAYRFLC